MIISKAIPKTTQHQRRLFSVDHPFESTNDHGRRRVVVGDMIERITATVFDGQRHKCSAVATYCPDVSAKGRFFECKAMGNSKQIFIYAGRLEKDCEFVMDHELFYVVWHHTVKTKDYETIEQLQWCAVMPFEYVYRICLKVGEGIINSNYGGTDRKTYGSGYRIPVRFIKPWIVFRMEQHANKAEQLFLHWTRLP